MTGGGTRPAVTSERCHRRRVLAPPTAAIHFLPREVPSWHDKAPADPWREALAPQVSFSYEASVVEHYLNHTICPGRQSYGRASTACSAAVSSGRFDDQGSHCRNQCQNQYSNAHRHGPIAQ